MTTPAAAPPKIAPLLTLADWDAMRAASAAPGCAGCLVDFYAAWCGPCKQIAPRLEAAVAQYPAVRFYKVDVDAAEELAQRCGIHAMPTFQLYRGGRAEPAAEVVGAQWHKVQELLVAATAAAPKA
jgi:thioredoxin 1